MNEEEDLSVAGQWHGFWLLVAPKVYEWLGWVAVTAALRYTFLKSHDIVLGVAWVFVWFCFCMYFNAFFYTSIHRLRRRNYPGVELTSTDHLISGAITIALAAGTNSFCGTLLTALSLTTP